MGGNKTACIQILANDKWNIYQDENISNVTGVGYKDLACLDYDPLDGKHVLLAVEMDCMNFMTVNSSSTITIPIH